jgi:hypothetical protein
MATDKAAGRQKIIDHLSVFIRKLKPGSYAREKLSFACIKEKWWLEQLHIAVQQKAAARWWNSVHADQKPILSIEDERLTTACIEYLNDTLSDWKIFNLRYAAKRVTLYDVSSNQLRCYPFPWQPVFDTDQENRS